MIDDTSPALRVALAYHRAWTGKDLDLAMTYVADDVVCDAPAGPIEGAAAYRQFMAPFVRMLVDATLIGAYGGGGQGGGGFGPETPPGARGGPPARATGRGARQPDRRCIFR